MPTPVDISPSCYPIFRGGIAGANQVVFADTRRSRVRYDAETFVIPKCRVLFTTARLWLFKHGATTFCTVTMPTAGSPGADGWYLGTVDFLGSDLAGAPLIMEPEDLFLLMSPTGQDATGSDCSFSVLGTRLA